MQRRGRWASIHVMNIYLQEIAVASCIPRLPSETRDRIEQLSQIFGEVLEQSLYFFENSRFPQMLGTCFLDPLPERRIRVGEDACFWMLHDNICSHDDEVLHFAEKEWSDRCLISSIQVKRVFHVQETRPMWPIPLVLWQWCMFLDAA